MQKAKYHKNGYKWSVFASLMAFFFLFSCASNKPVNDPELLNDALITFTVRVQAGNFAEATNLMTYEEQLAVLAPNGDVQEDLKPGMRALRVSALQNMDLSLDSEGKIVGMEKVLKDSRRKVAISQEQRSLNLESIESKYSEERKADSLARLDSIARAGSGEPNEADPAAQVEPQIEQSQAEDSEESEDLETTESQEPSVPLETVEPVDNEEFPALEQEESTNEDASLDANEPESESVEDQQEYDSVDAEEEEFPEL
jgi:hypothetical protein